MNPGELRDKVDICIKVELEGAVENLHGTYDTIAENIWMKRNQLLGKESIEMGLEHNTVQVNFISRKRNDISENMYIRHKGIMHNIIGFNELPNDKNYMLIATIRRHD
mgnify:CR=1 FL=1